jgi:FeS assembly SUF system protein
MDSRDDSKPEGPARDGLPEYWGEQPERSDDQGGVSRQLVVEALSSVYDPEIPVNIYELGLIYGLDIDDKGAVAITMTLTAPGCPVADILPGEVEEKVRAVPGVTEAKVELVWDPPWTPDRMSEAARLELGMF